ncbi:bifunctional diguanylate cyclase/phosphodiesterase [Treponema pectinovorum]|uniref:bifunctional diguanylate cyclase/phosphodiesterase n=1 Tax=Treponema pectinovorum TaxID=164 RepID=UPI0011F3C57A|nr:bifunctional diguanylate cyclase/phosphodiesterase [Treponema pectinovorum]
MERGKSSVFNIGLIIFAGSGILAGILMLLFQFIFRAPKVEKNPFFTQSPIGRVLYINSYDPSYIVTKIQLHGVDEILTKENILYEVMYMDILDSYSTEHYELFCQSVKHKLSISAKFDAILVSDDAALDFAQKYQDEFFLGLPIIFFGVNDIERAINAGKNPLITGFAEEISFSGTQEIMVEQNPHISEVVFIIDNSLTGRGDTFQLFSALDQYPNLNHKIISIDNFRVDEFLEILSKIPQDSAIICLSSLQAYARENGIPVHKFSELMVKSVRSIPIYRTNPTGMGAGFVGGRIYNYYNAAFMACYLLKGILAGDISMPQQVKIDNTSSYIFDYAVLKKKKLAMNTLPKDTVFINKPKSFLELYGKELLPFSIIFISLIIFLLFSIASYARSKKINGVMMLMNKRMRHTNIELIYSKSKLSYAANNDPLTELPNRTHGEEEIKKILKSGIPFSLFLMDIDELKNFNDSYTHDCGDFILKEFGKRLAKLALNNEYFVTRYGGDEFIIVHKYGHIEKTGKEIEKLHKILKEPLIYNGIVLDITVTMGFTDSSSELPYDVLIANADIAMYEAKKAGKGTTIAFVPEMREYTLKYNRIVEILKDECARGGFDIRYQPQVIAKTGEIYGFEALVRLQDYAVGPDDFIPVAEDSGFIIQIGRIVTEKVLAQMHEWRKKGMNLKKIAINYSNGQLVDYEYVPFLKKLLEKYEIPPEMIEIEITESLFIGKRERSNQLFLDLAEIGVSLALDDFGTGYSSLSYLTFVPAKKVKIDKSMVDNYLIDGKEQFIKNIVQLVHGLGMKLTVEGVENKWQFEKLNRMNCDYIQGYFFSKPMKAESVPEFTVAI